MTDHMSLMTYSWPWLITYDHCSSLSRTIIHDYHPWLSPMTIIHDYEHYLWTSPVTIRPYDLWLITCEYHTRLLPMTIIHDYEHHSWSITVLMTSSHHSWLSSPYVTYDYHRSLITRDDHLSPMTLITQDHHPWPSLPFTTHDYDFLLTTSTHVLLPMSCHTCLILSYLVSHGYLWPWLMTIMPYDLQLITRDYHTRPSSMTIIHDHQVCSLDFSPMTSHSWLLRSSHQWPWLP